MSSLEVKVNDGATPPLKNTLRKLGGGFPRSVWDVVQGFLIRGVTENFRVGGRPQRWRALHPITVAGRRMGSNVPLRDRGSLMLSVTSPGAPGNVRAIQGRTFTWGTRLKYASTHQPPDGAPQTVIRPKKAKMLAVPLNPRAALLSKRQGARKTFESEGLVVIRTRKGNLLGVKVKGRGSSRPGHRTAGGGRTRRRVTLEPWFLLTRQVIVTTRAFLVLPPEDVEKMGVGINDVIGRMLRGDLW